MERREILVVDDDKVTLKIIERILCRDGYSVIPIAYGKEAIKIAKGRHPALIILDIMMPDMDGGDVANILKRDPETREIPIIFLSSLITKNEERSSSPKYGIYFISKPFDREKLARQIERCLYRESFGQSASQPKAIRATLPS